MLLFRKKNIPILTFPNSLDPEINDPLKRFNKKKKIDFGGFGFDCSRENSFLKINFTESNYPDSDIPPFLGTCW